MRKLTDEVIDNGKSPCDGIGGTVKRLVSSESLRRPFEEQILTPRAMYEWCEQNIKNIKFFYVSSNDVALHKSVIKERLTSAKTIPGSRSHHRFIPCNEGNLKMFVLSCDQVYSEVSACGKNKLHLDVIGKVKIGSYVAAVYDCRWYTIFCRYVCQSSVKKQV